jgi:5-methylcytosine-specific restriction endonuclease McrA
MLQRSMTNELRINGRLSDTELLDEVKRLTAHERHATARLIAALGELDARRLYLDEGCSSLFTYCTQVLHFSEHAAYLRIEAARAARKWPAILDLLADGALHLTAISLLSPHLTEDNHRRVLSSARHKSKREVEEIVASLRPRPAVPSSVRKLPAPRLPSTATVESPLPERAETLALPATADPPPVCEVRARVAEVKALAPERYKVQFTASRETHDKLREAQNLLRHRIPDGDIAAIFDRALTALLAELRKARHAAVSRPRTASASTTGRYVPAGVKRAVWERDKGQCAFVGAQGRCAERGFLEYHHRVPYADGGATTCDNLELRCHAHNAYEAELWCGTLEEDLVREVGAGFLAR